MSEDDIDRLLGEMIDFFEDHNIPTAWLDRDTTYDEFKEMLYAWGDPFYTKERNYN